MRVEKTEFDGLLILQPKVFIDERGTFMESWNKSVFKSLGVNISFIQDNQSVSKKNVLRGLHFQKPPFEQSKLVRVLRGSILDIAVDLRQDSLTYLQYRSISLSESNFKQVFVPIGFAHGFLTLEDHCEISYKVSNPYDHDSDVSLSVFDKELNIELPCKREAITLSEKDAQGENIKSLSKIF